MRYTIGMTQYVAVLGRQPEFGLAELESLLGANAVTALPNGLALVSTSQSIPYARFGAIIKFAKVVAAVKSVAPNSLCTQIA